MWACACDFADPVCAAELFPPLFIPSFPAVNLFSHPPFLLSSLTFLSIFPQAHVHLSLRITWPLPFSGLCRLPLAKSESVGLSVICVEFQCPGKACKAPQVSTPSPCRELRCQGSAHILLVRSAILVSSLLSNAKPLMQRCFCAPWWWH